MECIELKKMRFHAYHGTNEQERIAGNDFCVDLKLYLDLSKSIMSDNINDTINYTEIFDLIKTEMLIPSQLIEHVSGRIVRRIKQIHPEISKITIRLAKLHPPVSGEMQEAAVIIGNFPMDI